MSPPTPRPTTTESGETLEGLLDALPRELALQVFTHASWADHRADSYERLAFLGDVVLSLAVSTHLFPRFERYGAGRLTKVRAQAVSGSACAKVALVLDVPGRLAEAAPPVAGRGVDALASSERVLASICEAVIGAAYLHFGIDRVMPAVVAAFDGEIEDALAHSVDYKSLLQERLAQRAEVVLYTIVTEDGPPHDRHFEAVAEVGGVEIGRGSGKSKKSAEQDAAFVALGQDRGPGIPDGEAS